MPNYQKNDTHPLRNSVTMKDVAKLAGVSHGTVSNVLNGARSVSVDKIKKVEKAVKELGYEQNALARSLKTASTGNSIYVIMPSLNECAYAEMFESISRCAEEAQYTITLLLSNELKYREIKNLNRAAMFGADGILLVTCQPENEKLFKKIMTKERRCVCMLREVGQINLHFVGLDIRARLAENITGHISAGIKKIAMLTGPKEYSFDAACIDGYLNALFAAGVDIKNHYLLVTDYDKESAMQQAIKLLNSDDPPEMIYATGSVVADGVRKAIALTAIDGVKVPKLVILSSRQWAKVAPEGEEDIVLPYGELGETAFQMLLEVMNGKGSAERSRKLISCRNEAAGKMYLQPIKASRKIKALFYNNGAGYAMKYLCNDFRRKTGIDVQIDLVGYRGMLDQIKESRDTGKYDIFGIDVPWIKELVMEDCIENLGGYIQDKKDLASRFPNMIFEGYALFNGEIWTLPFSFTTQLLFYRKDLFEELKYKRLYYEWYKEELRVPKTWEEYNRVARFFTKKFNSDSATMYGTALGGQVATGAASEYLPRVWANGMDLFSGENVPIDMGKCLKALQNYVECFKYAHPDSHNRWWEDEAMDFCSGMSAMMVQFTDQVMILGDRNISKVVGKTGLDAVPDGISLFGGWSIGMNSHSAAKEESFEFIKWTMAEDMAVANAVLGRIMPYTSVQNSAELLSLYPWHRDSFTAFSNAKKRMTPDAGQGQLVPENIVERLIGTAVHSAIVGECLPEEAVKRIVEGMAEALR